MSDLLNVIGHILATITAIFSEVSIFWQSRFFSWWTKKSPKDVLLESIEDARLFEEWEAAAYQLDEVLGFDLWRQNPTSAKYDYRLIYDRLQAIIETRESDDILGLVSILRSGLVRNLGNITDKSLFNKSYAGTKLLIEDYVTQVALAIEYVTSYPTSELYDGGLSNQVKMDVLHDTRQAFGRSALVLQGGSIFGMCHLGVVKALHLRGLLPRIIAGTATGALIAALVGVHTEDELLDFLSADGIDLTAFTKSKEAKESIDPKSDEKKVNGHAPKEDTWYSTSKRRIDRYWKTGHFLDIGVLERVCRANCGDLTFEEAYLKTKRVLNITVATSVGGVPNVLNYLTAPNVLIWSAALASNADKFQYGNVTLQCKNEYGEIVPWASSSDTSFRPRTTASHSSDGDSPLSRIAELFNVNHFIVSQARPYLAPFLRSDLHHPNPKQDARWRWTLPILRLIVLELQHRLAQLDALGYLPASARRFLLDETVPGAYITLVPELTPTDFFRLLENPTKASMNYWIRRGERSVWPAVGSLKVRCAIEVELDRGYQLVRRRKHPLVSTEPQTPGMGGMSSSMSNGAGGSSGGRREGVSRRKLARASSLGAGGASSISLN